jgi:hypothetical protein
MLTPESRGFGDELHYLITTMPGWGEANETLRRRIVTVTDIPALEPFFDRVILHESARNMFPDYPSR